MTGIDLSSNMVSIALERANKIQDIRVGALVSRGAQHFSLIRLDRSYFYRNYQGNGLISGAI